jgi:hypothetical protein
VDFLLDKICMSKQRVEIFNKDVKYFRSGACARKNVSTKDCDVPPWIEIRK